LDAFQVYFIMNYDAIKELKSNISKMVVYIYT